MSYLFIVVIGVVAGWVAGQFLKDSELGVGIDLAAGAIGALLAVFLVRFVGPAAASGFLLSALVAAIAAFGSVYVTRRFMKARLVPAPRPRRRV